MMLFAPKCIYASEFYAFGRGFLCVSSAYTCFITMQTFSMRYIHVSENRPEYVSIFHSYIQSFTHIFTLISFLQITGTTVVFRISTHGRLTLRTKIKGDGCLPG